MYSFVSTNYFHFNFYLLAFKLIGLISSSINFSNKIQWYFWRQNFKHTISTSLKYVTLFSISSSNSLISMTLLNISSKNYFSCEYLFWKSAYPKIEEGGRLLFLIFPGAGFGGFGGFDFGFSYIILEDFSITGNCFLKRACSLSWTKFSLYSVSNLKILLKKSSTSGVQLPLSFFLLFRTSFS